MINPVNVLGNLVFRKTLETTGPGRTFARLCTSHHLEDLQWIASLVVLTWLAGMGLLVIESDVIHWHLKDNFAISFGGLTAAAATAMTWTYQTGCSRIGAVDLFGTEITTICRVALVMDFARSSLRLPDASKRPPCSGLIDVSAQVNPAFHSEAFLKFTSEEHYTPVYDSNLSALQPLDAVVVTNVNEFYTYRKTMMDCLRRLATESPGTPAWRETSIQMIFMQFLMYESGRKAVRQLIEFKPNRAESTINIYCSELLVYRFLWEEYGREEYRKADGTIDFRFARLALREQNYNVEVTELLRSTQAQHGELWKRAQTTSLELAERFAEVRSRSKNPADADSPYDSALLASLRAEQPLPEIKAVNAASENEEVHAGAVCHLEEALEASRTEPSLET